jgi:hypothetical protein
MKKYFFILLLIPVTLSCGHNYKNSGSQNSIKKKVLDIAITYAKEKFKEPKETTASDGVITIEEGQVNFVALERNQIRYLIDPVDIATGLINDDSEEDAIITINSIRGQHIETPEHLILINNEGNLMLNRVTESDMKVLGIKDRIITAEVMSHSRNTPLRDCSACKEVVKFQFKAGELVRME